MTKKSFEYEKENKTSHCSNVELVYGTTEYEYEIDTCTGDVLSQDVDSIHD